VTTARARSHAPGRRKESRKFLEMLEFRRTEVIENNYIISQKDKIIFSFLENIYLLS